ncbi:MAG: heparan-alpha-glucosaminide N-acetyltransferase [Oscillospiraceae bacterium]|nr:heparan-alpha-glucosaminide N-acetyltransferase [Oscillospiraceae bacterium]MDD4413118.1 heparan-alpha-glucosaminide N-acetyltransferase [Oscillospiraceae bacterium]
MYARKANKKSQRIHFIDELRGLAVILMVAYHAFYTAGYLFDMEWGKILFQFFMPVEPFFAGMFIFISGISCRLSHSNLKRGLLLLAVAVMITVLLGVFMPDEIIAFGILHFLAVSILIFTLIRPVLDRIHPALGLLICGILLLITWWVPEHQGGLIGIKGLLTWQIPESAKHPWLYPLGLGTMKSSDYFPLLPWIFCFLGGSFFGVWAAKRQLPDWMNKQRIPLLSKAGRYSLLIYILHQPVIYTVCYIIMRIIRWMV